MNQDFEKEMKILEIKRRFNLKSIEQARILYEEIFKALKNSQEKNKIAPDSANDLKEG